MKIDCPASQDPARPVIHDDHMTAAALLVHGFASNTSTWDGLEESLTSQGMIVERLTLSGHAEHLDEIGSTPWQAWLADMRAGVQRLRQQADQVALVGHSMGCTIGLYALHERLVDRAVLIAPSVRVPAPSRALVAALGTARVREVPMSLVGARRAGEPDHPGYPQLTHMPVPALRTNLDFKATAASLDMRGVAPTMLIAGDHDRVVGGRAAREVLGMFDPGTQLVLLAGGDHNLPMSALAPTLWQLTAAFLRPDLMS